MTKRFAASRSWVCCALLASCGCGLKLPTAHPSLAPYRAYEQRPSTGPVTVVFLGTSSILVRDAQTTILTDPFVTRPALRTVGTDPIGPDVVRIGQTLDYLGIQHIDAIIASHSHYDHVMDAPEFARRTGARLVGSESTRNVGIGWPTLPSGRIDVVKDGETRSYGQFQLRFIASQHGPNDRYPGTIDEPLIPPQRVERWKTGETWSVLMRHGQRSLLFHGSGNVPTSTLETTPVDVVYLGIGGLGKLPDQYVEDYWLKVVRATGARRVILVHWDDFFRGLDQPLRPLPYAADSLPDSMRRLLRCAASDGVDVLLPVAWQTADPFAGLGEPRPRPAPLAPHPCQPPPGP